jgi:hypothetical protein
LLGAEWSIIDTLVDKIPGEVDVHVRLGAWCMARRLVLEQGETRP